MQKGKIQKVKGKKWNAQSEMQKMQCLFWNTESKM